MMTKWLIALVCILHVGVMPAGPAAAAVTSRGKPPVSIEIDISSQSMAVYVNGWTYGRWRVSTARPGYYTPRGSFRPFRTKRMHYSAKYDNAPMPHSIFFLGGYAIHGTEQVRSLGRPASHGCIRLAPDKAAKLYDLVLRHGLGGSRVSIVE